MEWVNMDKESPTNPTAIVESSEEGKAKKVGGHRKRSSVISM